MCLHRNQFVKRALSTLLPYTEEPFQCFWSPKPKLFKSNLVQILLPRVLSWDVSRKMAAGELRMRDFRNYEKVNSPSSVPDAEALVGIELRIMSLQSVTSLVKHRHSVTRAVQADTLSYKLMPHARMHVHCLSLSHTHAHAHYTHTHTRGTQHAHNTHTHTHAHTHTHVRTSQVA